MKSEAALRVNYYGEAFSASGYGTAVRAYIHALHRTGIRVAVIDAGRPPHQVEDALVESLIGREPDADFNLVHAIPVFWPRWAYSTRDVIAITVWEADPIPERWTRQLRRAIDVWVPCEFNVDCFARVLGKTPFRLPYALPASDSVGSAHDDPSLGVRPTDFVFYSIFDWQYRKNPSGMMEAFLTAFPDESDAVLLLKTIQRASVDAQRILDDVRSRTQSRGRVILRCESFDEPLMQALHDRGDCYISLHRGEGWGYPLFEAAARGKPTVASAQGGPLDYLDPKMHRLVHCDDQSVQEPYFLFRRTMTWGEPDLAGASKALRWVYEYRDEARAKAKEAALSLRTTYSLERVGEIAKERLMQLSRAKPQLHSA